MAKITERKGRSSSSRSAHTEKAIPGSLRIFFTELALQCAKSDLVHPSVSPEIASADTAIRLSGFFDELGKLTSVATQRGDFINVWEIAQLRRDELRNAAVLAWMLSPNASHGRGSAVLEALLKRLKERHAGTFPLQLPISGEYTVTTECCPFSDQSNRVDIVVDGRGFFLFLEIKIDAVEGRKQLERYLDIARRRSSVSGNDSYGIIYLTRFADPALQVGSDRLLLATWTDVAQAIRLTVPSGRPSSHSLVDNLFRQFAQHAGAL